MTASLRNIRTGLNAAMADARSGLGAVEDLCVACVRYLDVDGATVSTVANGAAQWTLGASDDVSRRLDEHQFTFGEGPCIDAVTTCRPVLVPDLDTGGHRWPAFTEAALGDGVRSVFALPITLGATPFGALDLFRTRPGPLHDNELAGAVAAADLAARSMQHLLRSGALDPTHAHHSGPGNGRGSGRGGDATDAGAADDTRGGASGRQQPREDERTRHDAMDLNLVEVYQATGVLIHQLDVGPGEALVRLRAHAVATNRTVKAVARDVIDGRLHLERDHHPHGPDHHNGGSRG